MRRICFKRDLTTAAATRAKATAALAALAFAGALSASGGAQAAETQIRLRAYVPVYCKLQPVPYFANTFGHHVSPPKVKVVCNTPYTMHMDGKWDGPGWPHAPFGHGKDANGKDDKSRDVEMRVTGQGGPGGGTQQALCSFSGGKEKSCRTLIDDNDGHGPPRVGEVTFGRPSYASNGGFDGGGWTSGGGNGGANSGPHGSGFAAPGSSQGHWGGRMSLGGGSLGGLPQVASTEPWPYVPSYLSDLGRERAANAAVSRDAFDDGMAADDAEQMTLSITVTGRY